MPIHDWARVEPGIFHDFHLAWIAELRRALNGGLLPEGYYALAEQSAGGVGPDVLTLQTPGPVKSNGNGANGATPGTLAVTASPPRVHQVLRTQANLYTHRQRTLIIRHVSEHRIVALLEIVSSGNKASDYAIRTFLDKVLAALCHGIHLLVLDLHPPTPRDPRGIHAAIWEELTALEQPIPELPLTLVAYSSGLERTAYVEPVAVGQALPDMPLFLEPGEYIEVPLERTYQLAYEGVPAPFRGVLEAPGT